MDLELQAFAGICVTDPNVVTAPSAMAVRRLFAVHGDELRSGVDAML